MARRTLVTLVVGALVVTACTRPEDEASANSSIAPVTDSTEVTDASIATTSPPTTQAVATSTTVDTSTETTETPTTTSPPTTTTVPPPSDASDLILIFDGILPFRFGDRDVDVVPALTELLGAPVLDEVREYPDAEEGVFFDPSGEESFVARFGRTTCFPIGLCVQFGAGAPETLIFTGWRVDQPSDLATDDGLEVGATLADFDEIITFDPTVSCYQVAYAAAAGIDVTLLSDDGVFAAPNADGDGLELGDPDPAQVTVIEMSAGQLPLFVFADC